MKVRKLAIALALAGGLSSGVAQALGLGEIDIRSHLNQPLNAQIDLRRTDGINPGDITVSLASERDYQRVGLTRNHFLSRLQFDVGTSPSGELRVTVTSREPVREPYLNFLVEVVWPSGRVMREYAVLVDPPVFAEDAAGRQPTQAPAATTRAPATQQAVTRPAEARPAPATTAARAQPGTYGPTGASDTLWNIALAVRPDSSVSIQQTMLALQDLNPDAFMDGNINRLRRGQVLRVPDASQIRQRTQAQAVAEVSAQNRAFADRSAAVDATAGTADAGRPQQPQQAAGTDELRLVVADTDRDARRDGSAGGDGRLDGTADSGRAVALEELDRIRRENDDLSSRMEDLQDQVETLQRLIELKDSQLAELQRAAGQEPSAPAQPDDRAPDLETPADDAMAPRDDAEADSAVEDDQDEALMAPVVPADGSDTTRVPPGDQPPAPEPADDPVAASGQPQEQPAQPQPAQQPGQSMVSRIIDMLASNPLYQVGLGLFLVLLLLLFLVISRRRAAAKEEAFYRQLEEEEGDAEGGFDLSLGEEAAEGQDVMAEADRYVSYGQHEAAAETLENAISREPSRSDLRLKLLSVYAAAGNRESFDKQYAELEAMELDEAMPEADQLRARLEETEATPSIDELESQLRSENYGRNDGFEEPGERSSELMADEFEARQPETPAQEDRNELMDAFDELDLPSDEEPGAEFEEPETDHPDRPIEYDLDGLGLDGGTTAEEDTASAEPAAAEDDLNFDFEVPAEEPVSTEEGLAGDELSLEGLDDLDDLAKAESDVTPEPVRDDAIDSELADLESSLEGDDTDLDESFLDELDAELDRAASDDEDDLSALELDVSDEDLALMDEVAEGSAEGDPELGELELEESLDDADLDLGDELTGESRPEAPAVTAEDELDDLDELDVPELDETIDDADTGNDGLTVPAGSAIDEIDESDLGDEEDFDFLAGTDEVATKLDLARAYVEMGDAEGAREILEEVILEGNDEQKTDAQQLLKKLP